jgi:exopolysaccharide biosynthesis polyprenyl glycosylphosphotransferase
VLRTRARLLHRLLLAFDLVIGALCFVGLLTVSTLRPDLIEQSATLPNLLVLGLVASLAWPFALDTLDLYRSQRRTSLLRHLAQLAGIGLAVTVALAVTTVATRAPVAPIFPFALGVLQMLLIGGSRAVAHIGLRVLRRSGRNYRNVLVVGSGPRALEARAVIENHPEWGLRLVGFLDETDFPLVGGIEAHEVHKLMDLPRILKDEVVDEVVVACPRSMLEVIAPVVSVCAAAGVPITLLSDVFGDYLPAPRVTNFGSLAALNFAPVHHSRSQLVLKRAIDVVVSAVALAISAPVIAVAAIAVKRSSPGPLFFRQVRCGLHGRRFEMLKLRTMVADAESRRDEYLSLNEMDGPVFKIRNDPRITPVGRFLRRWSIDELPQFWNVLRGDMSLVGPRPPIPAEVVQYETSDRRRLSMRPGLTCLWQVEGRNSIGFAQWVKLDLLYIDTFSIVQDLKILAKTIPAVLRGSGH